LRGNLGLAAGHDGDVVGVAAHGEGECVVGRSVAGMQRGHQVEALGDR
jgi:hypothetical protein